YMRLSCLICCFVCCKVFPPLGHSVAGVFQVSYVNSLNQPYYAFNASDARSRCESLGVNIASVSQVINALTRGLETCRFGWTDEHLAVVPRVTAQVNCGQNQTGLVRWRAPITKKFDVFCFNESGMKQSNTIYLRTIDAPRTEKHKPSDGSSLSTMGAKLKGAKVALPKEKSQAIQ
uniref:Link domain-containing protein n=1 Tax=Periophthalmus magnuspinnatus TaxID=409849 RepID=A0A3B3ZCP4_9GOBI